MLALHERAFPRLAYNRVMNHLPSRARVGALAVAVATFVFLAVPARADTPIPLGQLPAAVTKTLADYFPRSQNLSAQRDGDDAERTRYKVKLRYRSITLEVEVTPQGRIADVDMDDKPAR